jgi:exodeoxyribonuclease-3
MKFITYNVNGLRSAIEKGLLNWLANIQADIVCLQEVKCRPDQVDTSIFESLQYFHYWSITEKKGYSGVLTLSKHKPLNFFCGVENEKFDREGRAIRLDFKDFSILNVYMPSGSSGQQRQAFKMEWLDYFFTYAFKLKSNFPNLIISGDFNICHQPIDIHNPIANANSSGFLPEEREWMTKFFNSGFVDAFRYLCKEPHHYTWWSFRANARARNLGWRIDYHTLSFPLLKSLKNCLIMSEIKHSDHCPVLMELDI